jgi:hypothetical protein
MRPLPLLALALLVAGCPSYDRYTPIIDQDGLVSADRFAAYGAEQAQAVAIGRAFGAAFGGAGPEAYARQAAAAVKYARSLPGVASVVSDTTGYVLTVTFKSGWKKAVVPIADGVPADQTPGLPAR